MKAKNNVVKLVSSKPSSKVLVRYTHLPPETEDAASLKASQLGVTFDEYVGRLIKNDLQSARTVTGLHESSADEAEVIVCCHEQWKHNPNTLAMLNGRWFTCSIADGSPETVCVGECQELTLLEACRWFVRIDDFSEGFDGTLAPLLADVVYELERLGAK